MCFPQDSKGSADLAPDFYVPANQKPWQAGGSGPLLRGWDGPGFMGRQENGDK
jgi:hypothetical protein